MATAIEICSNALNMIGHGKISSFTEGGAGANASEAFYETTYLNLLSMHRWRFASAKVKLGQLTNEPINNWQYTYQLPADYVVATFIYPRADYEIYEDKILTNSNSVDLDYIFRVDESMIPSHFQRLVELDLASLFAISVTDSSSKADEFRRMMELQLRRTRYADAQARPVDTLPSSPFVDARR